MRRLNEKAQRGGFMSERDSNGNACIGITTPLKKVDWGININRNIIFNI